jgi:hypothetical protein
MDFYFTKPLTPPVNVVVIVRLVPKVASRTDFGDLYEVERLVMELCYGFELGAS